MTSHLDTGKAVEAIAAAYLALEADAMAALTAAVRDALADLAEKERRLEQANRLISKGYVRSRDVIGEE